MNPGEYTVKIESASGTAQEGKVTIEAGKEPAFFQVMG